MKTIVTVLLTALILSLLATPTWARDVNPPSAELPGGPPDTNCTPTSEPDDWLCNGDPDAKPLTDAEQTMLNYVQQRHPSFTPLREGHSIIIDSIPQPYIQEYFTANHSAALFKIGNFTQSQLLDLHSKLLPQLTNARGYVSSGVDKDGIFVEAETVHGSIPSNYQGARIRVIPPRGAVTLGETSTYPQRPVHPATEIGFADLNGVSRGTLSGIVLARGQPWAIFPGHLLEFPLCFSDSPQIMPAYSNNNAIHLSDIPRYTGATDGQYYLTNPPTKTPETPFPFPIIGFATVWDNLDNHRPDHFINGVLYGYDLAAAALDNNKNARDKSQAIDSVPNVYEGDASKEEYEAKLPTTASQTSNLITLQGVIGVAAGMEVDVLTADVSNSGIYKVPATIISIGNNRCVLAGCDAHPYTHCSIGNFLLQTKGRKFLPGDSGSPVVTNGGGLTALPNYFVGFLNFSLIDPTGLHPELDGLTGGGIPYDQIKRALILDSGDPILEPNELRSKTNLFTASSVKLEVKMNPTAFKVVRPGAWACTGALITNTGTVKAKRVQITFDPNPADPPPPPGVQFGYYNAKKEWNTPLDIGPGKTRRFRPCFRSDTPVEPGNAFILNFWGQNAASPIVKTYYNTLKAIWTTTPTPSFLTFPFTGTLDDVVHTNGTLGDGTFIVYVTNVGAAGQVTIEPRRSVPGGVALPYSVRVCEMSYDPLNILNETCLQTPSISLSRHFDAGENAHFRVSASGLGQEVKLNPYFNRIFLTFLQDIMIGQIGLSVTTN